MLKKTLIVIGQTILLTGAVAGGILLAKEVNEVIKDSKKD